MAVIIPAFPVRDGNAFLQELRLRVDQHFRGSATSPKGNWAMVRKTLTMLTVTFGSFGAILWGGFSTPVMWALTVVVGFGLAGIGFAVGHDALHGAYSDSKRVNCCVGWAMDLIGGSSYLWKITHNVIHHTYTNIHGADEDLVVSPLLRLSPHAERHWFHRFQHWYALVLYSMTSLFWIFVKDYKYLLQKDIGPYADRRHSLADLSGVALGKAVAYGWSIVLPFVVLDIPWWQVTIGIVTAHLVAGVTLGIVFQLAHVVEETQHPLPDAAGDMPQSWVVHELATTANFAPDNRFLGWYVGGLNFQVEHHLFPKVCSVHYPVLSGLVRELAAKHGLPYHSHVTFRSAVASHLRTLKAFGASDPVAAPAGCSVVV
ncbi:MAG: acyl-CoA desaturase [Gemmatimonadales bacterium]|nr:acyl-CoA desaturase [Gemmatimonadales bacterium]